MAEQYPQIVSEEERVAGIVVEVSNERVTALTPVTPEIMMVQKELAMRCSEIVKF